MAIKSAAWRKRTLSVFKELGIPGPEPNLIFGNLLEIWKEGMGPCSSKWLKQYGDVVGYYNGAMPGIVTRDRELIKRIFINDFQYFTGRQIMALVSKNLPVNEVRLSRVSGDDWRYLKNVLIPAFKTNNIKKGPAVAPAHRPATQWSASTVAAFAELSGGDIALVSKTSLAAGRNRLLRRRKTRLEGGQLSGHLKRRDDM
ncbi:hypothetical protein HPB51_018369 [Rhipicephalus microplus]|uniref:Uncharacterized protein n=1 Tax=Rhipicephalus microplus TaxID=6941 RepID=A0A9J6ETZ6_RHIMP|nr:hypothetical protein HPB51_018369 [Rhipicephalus microplus]